MRSSNFSTPRPWRPLNEEEVACLSTYVVHRGSGRPMFDVRARLDAVFWVLAHKRYWRELPPELGPWDTAHRQFRRWTHKGVWTQLLKDAAAPGASPVLRRLEHWICLAFRRV